jgi:hypothetical protein
MSARVAVLVLYCIGSVCFFAGSLLSLWMERR